jgi:hypothetical protein
MGRPKGSRNHGISVVCPECDTRHLAGARCPDPATDKRPSFPDNGLRLNILDHRVHGIHEAYLDLKYNPEFALSVGTSALAMLKRLEEAYQAQYDALAEKLQAERDGTHG